MRFDRIKNAGAHRPTNMPNRSACAWVSTVAPPAGNQIEDQEAIRNIDSIIQPTDVIMIARGDLGVEVEFEELRILQRRIVCRSHELGRRMIVATQLLESMISSPTPTRAEVTDVSNATFEEADTLMLSGETSVGAYPLRCIEAVVRITSDRRRHKPPVCHSDTYRTLAAASSRARIEALAQLGPERTRELKSEFEPLVGVFGFDARTVHAPPNLTHPAHRAQSRLALGGAGLVPFRPQEKSALRHRLPGHHRHHHRTRAGRRLLAHPRQRGRAGSELQKGRAFRQAGQPRDERRAHRSQRQSGQHDHHQCPQERREGRARAGGAQPAIIFPPGHQQGHARRHHGQAEYRYGRLPPQRGGRGKTLHDPFQDRAAASLTKANGTLRTRRRVPSMAVRRGRIRASA